LEAYNEIAKCSAGIW